MIGTTLTWLVVHRNKLVKAILGLSVGILLAWGIMLSKQNKKLSESLERAQNNIEAYQGSLQGSQQANNVLRLTVDELQTYNDKLVHQLDSVREKLKIKPKQVHTAATQTQIINVIQTVENDSTYNGTINFNDLTTANYSISKDSVTIGLDVRNTQYLYVFVDRHYKNKKNFFQRLFTWDFKKVTTYEYVIENTNDLIQTDSVRVIELTEK